MLMNGWGPGCPLLKARRVPLRAEFLHPSSDLINSAFKFPPWT